MKPVGWYLENGCELCSPSPILLVAIYQATNGNPCDGCNCKSDCRAFKLINHPTTKSHPTERVETNAEIAKRLGMSKRQVSKMARNCAREKTND